MKRQKPHSGAAVCASNVHGSLSNTTTSTGHISSPDCGSLPRHELPPLMRRARTGSASSSRSISSSPDASSRLQRRSACSHAGVTNVSSSRSSSSASSPKAGAGSGSGSGASEMGTIG
eukprot:scaffold48193_cov38-Tisochrysis_lutea.AAC.2